VSSTESDGADLRLQRQFWLLVGLANVAMLATALGVLVLVFWSRPTLGVGLLAVGVGATVFGWLRYRRIRAGLSESA
jgi:hypothetical protein